MRQQRPGWAWRDRGLAWSWRPAAASGGGRSSRGDDDRSQHLILHTVARDDFELNVTERGEVEAFDVTEIRSLVKSNNTTGNAILRIVPEGTVVKKGDFLVELDSSALKAQRTTQKILVNTAKAAEVEAHNIYDTAVIAKREYLEGTNMQERQTIESEVFVAEENLNRAKEYYAYSQKLASKGYVNELQLEADHFAVEKAKKDLDTAQHQAHGARRIHQAEDALDARERDPDRQGQVGFGPEQPRAGTRKAAGARRPDRQVHDHGAAGRRGEIRPRDGRPRRPGVRRRRRHDRPRAAGDHSACRTPIRCA